MAKKPDINRLTAMEILNDIEKNQAYSNIAINAYIKKNNPDSQALVREIVYGVLRNKMYLDYILVQLSTKPVRKTKPEILTIIRMGLYQLIFMNSVPQYAAVNESVDLAKKYAYGQTGFVNAILRAWIRSGGKITLPDKDRDPVSYYSVLYSYPEWIVRMWIKEYGESFAESLMAAGNATPELCIRYNRLKTTRESMIAALNEKGFVAEKGRLSDSSIYVKGSGLLDTEEFTNGLFSIQDESSMLAVEILDPRPDERVIDVCAAPGGKTLYTGEIMGNRGNIHAFDIHRHKLELLRSAAVRNGIGIIKTEVWDGSKTMEDLVGKADRVLVDAPCSGLGVVRRKPEIKYAKEQNLPEKLARSQFEILSAASKYVKNGGILLYTTCTVVRQENEMVVARFLESDSDFELLIQKQLFPNTDGSDGFFICKMRKKK